MHNMANANVSPAGISPEHHQLPNMSFKPAAGERLPVTPIVNVEPRFIEHLTMYKGQNIMVCTTVEKMAGVLDDVAIDHLALMVNGKKHHVRFDQIVYFA
jgi:hypothetical protein